MGKLIVNADDFGYSVGVNRGIILAHNKGIVSSTTMMANMPGFEDGIQLLKENPTLSCGVHMTLSCYKPLLGKVNSLTDSEGNFYRKLTEEIVNSIDLDELFEEFCAQIDRVQKYIDVSHLDSHHHVHTIERFRPVIERICEKYKLPIRKNMGIESVKNVEFIGTFYLDNVSVEWFEKNANEINSKGVVDIMSHPALLDEFIYKSTSYNIERMKELSILTNPKVKEILKNNNITLTNYKNL